MIIRAMEEKDLEQVLLLEQLLYKTPWSQQMFRQELTDNKFAHLFVAEEYNHIIGYCGVWMIMDEAMITKVSVMKPLQGRGIGKIILQDLLNRIKLAGCIHLSLEVRVSNQAAIHLYESFGFKKVATRKNYYPDGEDAYAMIQTLKEEGNDGQIHIGN